MEKNKDTYVYFITFRHRLGQGAYGALPTEILISCTLSKNFS